MILGEENIEIQSKIEISETQIKHLQTEKIKLNSEQELTQQNVDRQQQVIDNFKVDSARSIKRKLELSEITTNVILIAILLLLINLKVTICKHSRKCKANKQKRILM